MAAPNNPARGAELPHAKLDRTKVETIRIRASMGVRHEKLAAEHGVHVNTIQRVVSYENWWHL